MPDHHLFQSVADMSTQRTLDVPLRPAEIPKLELAREMSNVSPRVIEPMIKSPLSAAHHRNLNALKDPEGLFLFFTFFLLFLKFNHFLQLFIFQLLRITAT